VTGGFTFRAAFFTGACLGLAVAAVRFVAFPLADLDTLRALPRVADFLLGSFPRFCNFDAFLRLVMIAPLVLRNDTTVQVAARYQTRVITRFQFDLMAVVPAARAALEEQPVLQRGHVEKCKAWRTRSVTDFPAVRHVLGIERWCSQRTCLRRPRPPTASAENKSAPPWPRHIEGCWGLPFSTAKARYAERGRKKAVTRP
jgi:hypothetical protein